MDSAIDMPTSSVPFPDIESNGFHSSPGLIPGSLPPGSQESTVSLTRGLWRTGLVKENVLYSSPSRVSGSSSGYRSRHRTGKQVVRCGI